MKVVDAKPGDKVQLLYSGIDGQFWSLDTYLVLSKISQVPDCIWANNGEKDVRVWIHYECRLV